MARTVVAIFDNFQTANDAVRELVDSGFPRDNISIIANNSRGEYGYYAASDEGPAAVDNDTVADETGAGAGVGAGIGAAIGGIGGLLVGLGALTIPGIGPVIAAGPLAVALSTLTGAGVGAVAGGVTGGLLGALIGLGVPEEEAEYYAEGVRRGGVLVTVQADDYNTDQITDVLNRHDPINIKQRANEWREQGWTGFDPNAKPVGTDRTNMTQPYRRGGIGVFDTSDDVDETTTSFNPTSPDYQNHYNTYLAGTGYPFDYYIPAYQYGYGLRSNSAYQNRKWGMIEPEIRRDWERDHPGTWERFKPAIRHGWQYKEQ